jgi:hypothetical protein
MGTNSASGGRRGACAGRRRQRPSSTRPQVEALEDRLVPTVTPQAIAAINADYAANAYLGNPVTNFLNTPNNAGAYRDYQNGSIYYSWSTGAHEVGGAIKAKWLSLGGVSWGYPTTDETTTPDHLGRYNHFASLYTVQVGTHSVQVWAPEAIDWTPQYGANRVDGANGWLFANLGWENFGEATTDPTLSPDGLCWYNHFQRQYSWGLEVQAIDWTQQYGSHFVSGQNGLLFQKLGWENFGEATTDPTLSPDGLCWYNQFERKYPWGQEVQAIDWTNQYGSHYVDGAIAQFFFDSGAENYFGEVITDPRAVSSGGCFAHFQHQDSSGLHEKAIDWTPANGAHAVLGPIYQYFVIRGGEQGEFGCAIGDQGTANSNGDQMQMFQRGEIQSESFPQGTVILSAWEPNSTTLIFNGFILADPAILSQLRETMAFYGVYDCNACTDSYLENRIGPQDTSVKIDTTNYYTNGGSTYYFEIMCVIGWTNDLVYTMK